MRYTKEMAMKHARRACMAAGASEAMANALAAATVAAEFAGRTTVGLAHLLDYIAAFATGGISGIAWPEISFPAPALIRVDAKGGIAQLGFDLAFDELCTRTNLYGITAFAQENSYTAGELGYYTRRLADMGLVAIAATNGPALMAAKEEGEPVYGTNPISFAAPVAESAPLVIDQASSASAFVNIRLAAEKGESIPEGWAIDHEGKATTDARAALKGALLAFGGPRGANIALMVEVLAAGVTGANWSLDAPSFTDSNHSPGVGIFVVALKPDLLDPLFSSRLKSQIERLREKGIHIPGQNGQKDEIELPQALVEALVGTFQEPA